LSSQKSQCEVDEPTKATFFSWLSRHNAIQQRARSVILQHIALKHRGGPFALRISEPRRWPANTQHFYCCDAGNSPGLMSGDYELFAFNTSAPDKESGCGN
jgi:hypothetical protein